MAFDLVSTLGGFLLGTATGAAGGYFASKYTDQRRNKEAAKEQTSHFDKIKYRIPLLIAEMEKDFSVEANAHIREFFVLPHDKVMLGGSEKPRFVYYEDQYDNLRGQLDILENEGYIDDVTPGNAPIYRMTEEFVELLIKHP